MTTAFAGDGAGARARRAVVTGGAGFVGSTLVDRLLSDGWTVVAVDSFDPYYPADRKRSNLAEALRHPRFTLAEVDTRDRSALADAFGAAAPTVVFDLAARAGVRPSLADPEGYIDVNVRGLQHTLAATAAASARLVYASSSSIYGDDERRPFREDQARGMPLSPYAATKVAGEALVHAHHAATGLPVGVARLFTVYGPRQRPDLAICTFARQMLAGEPVRLFGDGALTRDYTYVDDVVEALLRLASSEHGWLVVNVGSGHPVSTLEVVDQLERALGVRADRRSAPQQPGDVEATFADIGRAAETLGWVPGISFEEGIQRFCDWYRSAIGPSRSTGSPTPR
jgi:UDP-glucuronate 4-epimerase